MLFFHVMVTFAISIYLLRFLAVLAAQPSDLFGSPQVFDGRHCRIGNIDRIGGPSDDLGQDIFYSQAP